MIGFLSEETSTNRYGDKYWFEVVGDNKFLFKMNEDNTSLKYCRMGGKPYQEKVDMSDLGMFDPSGGPYIALGIEIDGKPITRISSVKEGFLLEVE